MLASKSVNLAHVLSSQIVSQTAWPGHCSYCWRTRALLRGSSLCSSPGCHFQSAAIQKFTRLKPQGECLIVLFQASVSVDVNQATRFQCVGVYIPMWVREHAAQAVSIGPIQMYALPIQVPGMFIHVIVCGCVHKNV